MGGTSLKRKALRNRLKAKVRKSTIKRLTIRPVQKNVDIDELKAGFQKPSKAKPASEKVEKPAKEVSEVMGEVKSAEIEEKKAEKKAKAEKVAEVKAEVKEEKEQPKADKAPADSKKPKAKPKK